MECKSQHLRALLAHLTTHEERYKHIELPKPLPWEAELRASAAKLSQHEAEDKTLDFRRCQSYTLTYLKELLKRTYAVPAESKRRAQALLLLIEVSADHAQAAYLVAESGLFQQAVLSNLECEDQPQQGLMLLTVVLVACVAHQVPESQAFRGFLGPLMDIACDYGTFKPFRPLQIHAVEALVHLCYARTSRQHLCRELCSAKVESLLRATRYRSADGAPVKQHIFLVCMLLANLCDLNMPVTSDMSSATFGYVGFSAMWRSEDFFISLALATAAAVRREPWPPDTEMRWPPWKLVQTVERLARHGYAAELRLCATSLMSVVAETSQGTLEHPVRTSRLAAEALRAIAAAANDTDALRTEAEFVGPALLEVLRQLADETPAAEDLLDLFQANRDPLPYMMHSDLIASMKQQCW